jgi:hypothetical protein
MDKAAGVVYISRMIRPTASFWYFYFSTSLAAGGFRAI